MIYESQTAFHTVEINTEETPVIPVIIRNARLCVSHGRLLIFIDPEPVAACRTCYYLLRLDDEIVVAFAEDIVHNQCHIGNGDCSVAVNVTYYLLRVWIGCRLRGGWLNRSRFSS